MKLITIKIILLLNIPLQGQHVESFLLSHGVKAKVEIINISEQLILGNQNVYFKKLERAFLNNDNKHVHILTSPFIDSLNEENMLGLTRGRLSMSVWNDVNSAGQEREIQSWVAMLHELGHQFGLNHTTGCKDVMDAAAMACPNVEQLTFSKSQLKAIKAAQ